MIRRRRSQIRDYQAEARLFASRAIVAFFRHRYIDGLAGRQYVQHSGEPVSRLSNPFK